MGYIESPFLIEDGLPEFAYGLGYWIAVIEPLGIVKEDNDYLLYFDRSTDELRVKKIMAFCKGCHAELREGGLVVDVHRYGNLYPVCGLEIHGQQIASERMQYFRFSFDQDSKVIFKD